MTALSAYRGCFFCFEDLWLNQCMFACILICDHLQTSWRVWIANGHLRQGGSVLVSIKSDLPIEVRTIEWHYITQRGNWKDFFHRNVFNMFTSTLFPPRSHSAHLISLPVHLGWWLCLTTVAMGELAQLRKEVENLKEQIEVSISSLKYTVHSTLYYIL